MRGHLSGSARGRAAIAVAALYVLVLQAFLGALQPVGLPPMPGGVICAEHPDAGLPGDERAACRQHACCIPARVAQPLPDMLAVSDIALCVPQGRAAVPLRPPHATVTARAPPDPAIPPRGPPAA